MHYGCVHLSFPYSLRLHTEDDTMHADQLTGLSQMIRAVRSARDSREACLASGEGPARWLEAVWPRVWINASAGRLVRSEATFGIDHEVDALTSDVWDLPRARGHVGRISERRTPEYIRDIAQDPR